MHPVSPDVIRTPLTQEDYVPTPIHALYTAEGLATGEGRQGHVRTMDGALDLTLAAPKEFGGSGAGVNPEQLFAAGYAACFHSALLTVARSQKLRLEGTSVGARVSLGARPEGGYGLGVDLQVTIPKVPAEQAQALAEAAHAVCPYSNAMRGNVEVRLSVSDD